MEDTDLWAWPKSSDPRDVVAEDNQDAQTRLFFQLQEAAEEACIDVATVAKSLGVDEATAMAALHGQIDMTLSDLLQVAYSVDAHVGYSVVPNYSRKCEAAIAPPDWFEVVVDWHDEREVPRGTSKAAASAR